MSADGESEHDQPAGDDRAGQRVGGRYELIRLIGRGGMGEVYAARNEATGREVALKMIRAANATVEQNKRFLREAKAATAIRHRNVIDILDVFEDDDGTPVMVMELLSGRTLKQLVGRRGTLSLGQAATILLPVVSALRTAHAKGIVHRDLKPDNIFLAEQPDGEVVPKVLDFGIAKVIDPTTIAAETQGGQTHTGSILGTPHYMSFEQAMSEKDIDHRADVWALGVILFEVLTGRRPLDFENLGQMYTAFLQGSVPSVRDHASDLPDDVATVIDACLAKERDDRLGDLGPVLEALQPHADAAVAEAVGPLSDGPESAAADRTLTGTGTQGAFAATVDRAGRRSRVVLLGAAAALLVGAGALFVAFGSTGGAGAPAAGSEGDDAAALTPSGADDEALTDSTAAEPEAELAGAGGAGGASADDSDARGKAARPGLAEPAAAQRAARRAGRSPAAPAGRPTSEAAAGTPSSAAAASAAGADSAGRRPKGIAHELPY